jgi:nucleoside-diphosphate-sugar epimerase
MKAIGILGANSQVGTEVCLYLSMFPDIHVVPICRTQAGSAFLRRMGLECRHGSVANADEALALLRWLDVIVDFGRPVGVTSQVIRDYRANISNVIRAAPEGSKYIFISSLMALGMRDSGDELKYRVFSGTAYGYTKRYAERLARRLGRATRRETWILRLGEVYGPLQSTSRGLTNSITNERALVPDAPSYTVFGFTIAEALANVARDKEKPGVYSLVSVPPYSWEEIYRCHAEKRDIRPGIGTFENSARDSSARLKKVVDRLVLRRIMTWIAQHREMLASYVLSGFPALERQLKGAHLRRRANHELNSYLSKGRRPFDVFRGNTIPGARLASLSDPRTAMAAYEAELVKRLDRMWCDLDNAGHFPAVSVGGQTTSQQNLQMKSVVPTT